MDRETIALDGGEAILYRNVFGAPAAARLFTAIEKCCAWRQAEIRLFGRRVASPRLTAWYGARPYTYSNLTWPAQPWPAPLNRVRRKVEAVSGATFNGVLANLYRDGADSMGWHSDDEAELGPAPVIASLSLGAARRFIFRRRDDSTRKVGLILPDDSLLVMSGATQANWRHAVPKTARPVGPRLNLTFREIL